MDAVYPHPHGACMAKFSTPSKSSHSVYHYHPERSPELLDTHHHRFESREVDGNHHRFENGHQNAFGDGSMHAHLYHSSVVLSRKSSINRKSSPRRCAMWQLYILLADTEEHNFTTCHGRCAVRKHSILAILKEIYQSRQPRAPSLGSRLTRSGRSSSSVDPPTRLQQLASSSDQPSRRQHSRLWWRSGQQA